ncbi:MAG: ABC transporter ATP-binding protein [Planctomycetota bacterium]
MTAVLELRGVRKTYGEAGHSVEVLRGIDLSVQPGEFVAIVGPSGSGKSTLLNLLGCLDRPSAGAYLLEGEDSAQLDDFRLSRMRNERIGFVFQSFMLVPHLSVRENVELPLLYARVPRGRRRQRCVELIEQVGLGHRLGHRPNQLSGGECQRVAVARALANDPALLLADEPTGNLDSKTSADILRLFFDLHAAGRTLVMITHDAEIAAKAPRRVVIRDGLIREDTALVEVTT